MREYNVDITEKINKPFMRKDIIVYAILVLISIALFIFTLNNPTKSVNGFKVTFDNIEILNADFENRNVNILDESLVEKLSDRKYKIQTELGMNVLEIDFDNSVVKVIETDCGLSKECTYMNLSDGIIVCAPHKIVIKPNTANGELIIG